LSTDMAKTSLWPCTAGRSPSFIQLSTNRSSLLHRCQKHLQKRARSTTMVKASNHDGAMDMDDYLQKYNQWLNAPFIDSQTKAELAAAGEPAEIEDRFYKDLEFGTGGLRGIMGAGTNRVNIYTIRKASFG